MKEGTAYERVRFLKHVDAELKRLFCVYGTNYSENCYKYMKLIFSRLKYELYLYEEQRIQRMRETGKITSKEAWHMKAENKKWYLL